jgi:hypothetical protein
MTSSLIYHHSLYSCIHISLRWQNYSSTLPEPEPIPCLLAATPTLHHDLISIYQVGISDIFGMRQRVPFELSFEYTAKTNFLVIFIYALL